MPFGQIIELTRSYKKKAATTLIKYLINNFNPLSVYITWRNDEWIDTNVVL